MVRVLDLGRSLTTRDTEVHREEMHRSFALLGMTCELG